MNLRVLICSLIVTAAGSASALAQTIPPPEPLAMGVSYVYQLGNPNWYAPVAYYPSVYVSPNPWYLYSSPFPFGSVSTVFGAYSWDYGVMYPATVAWYPGYPAYPTTMLAYPTVVGYPAHYVYGTYSGAYTPVVQYPTLPGRTWGGFWW
jgi:hypothetical protein